MTTKNTDLQIGLVVVVVVVVVVMLVLNAGLKDLVVQLAIHPIVLKSILI